MLKRPFEKAHTLRKGPYRNGPSLHNSQTGTRDQKLTPRSRMQHPTCGQNRHWATEDAEERGGAAKDTTGDHCSDTILYPLRYRQPMEYIPYLAVISYFG